MLQFCCSYSNLLSICILIHLFSDSYSHTYLVKPWFLSGACLPFIFKMGPRIESDQRNHEKLTDEVSSRKRYIDTGHGLGSEGIHAASFPFLVSPGLLLFSNL
ncbi:hypothetical protein FOYG_01614 [Fusarium oxysporum NRRL 32931]|uniref:Uncharacterized protein n=1 Tax=Fusarium oxysporum NRRL 32931 TaxID=660029 RepID=W9JC68_FUSOX|nr:hypothetical protein FOYG_01614 [Fusarium oxysporum NRRL 32931]